MYYIANFARPKGAKDKKPRKQRSDRKSDAISSFKDKYIRPGVVQERMAERQDEYEKAKKRNPKLLRHLGVASTGATLATAASPFIDKNKKRINIDKGKKFYKTIVDQPKELGNWLKGKVAQGAENIVNKIPNKLTKVPGIKGIHQNIVEQIGAAKGSGKLSSQGLNNVKTLLKRNAKASAVATAGAGGIYALRKVLNRRERNKLATAQATDYVSSTRGGSVLKKKAGSEKAAIKTAKKRVRRTESF